MDFLDPTKKRAHIIRLFIGYGLVAIVIGIATYILGIMTFKGYGVDSRGTIIQNGLVQVSAQPQSAAVYVNGVLNSARTDTRLTLPAGPYTVELKRSGYRPWQRAFTLDGGGFTQLDARLFPQKLTVTDVQLYGTAPTLATQSLDKRWLLVQQPGNFLNFDEFNLIDLTQPPTVLTLPASLLTASSDIQSLQVVEWASDNRHFLVKHLFGTNQEFLMIDREAPENSVNITKLLGSNADQVVLKDKRPDQVFTLDTKTEIVRSLDFKNPTPITVLTHVLAFKAYGPSTFLYISDTPSLNGKVTVKFRDNNKDYNLRALASGSNYVLDETRYNNHWFIICGSSAESRVYIYKDPQSTTPSSNGQLVGAISSMLMDHPQYVNFSTDSRFVVAQSGQQFAVYDAEADRRFYFTLKSPVENAQFATWVDGSSLSLASNGKMTVFDYDGANQQTLSAAVTGFPAFFDHSYSAMYLISPSVTVPSRFALTRTELKVP